VGKQFEVCLKDSFGEVSGSGFRVLGFGFRLPAGEAGFLRKGGHTEPVEVWACRDVEINNRLFVLTKIHCNLLSLHFHALKARI
jgi:hypothetical protein